MTVHTTLQGNDCAAEVVPKAMTRTLAALTVPSKNGKKATFVVSTFIAQPCPKKKVTKQLQISFPRNCSPYYYKYRYYYHGIFFVREFDGTCSSTSNATRLVSSWTRAIMSWKSTCMHLVRGEKRTK